MPGINGRCKRCTTWGTLVLWISKSIINAINIISNNHVVPCADDYIMYWDIWTAGDIFFYSFIK